MQLSHRQKVTTTTVLVILIIIMMLLLAEGAVRFRQWMKQGYSGNISDLYLQEDDLRTLVPDARTQTISINSLGFRGPDLTPEKPSRDLRIAFLGASTTFCAEVSGNDFTWPHLVVEALQEEFPDLEIDYVNAAVPGYSVKTSLLNFRRRVASLRPDVTIIYHATNDLSWETRFLAQKAGIYEDRSSKQKSSWLLEHSRLWYLVVKNLRIKEVQKDALNARKRLEFFPLDLGSEFRKELTQLVIEAKTVSKVVALVTFAHRIRPEQTPEQQLVAAGSALYYMPYMTPQSLMDAFERYNQIIAEVAKETGVILIGGEAVIPGDDEHFNDSVHFKDAGSRVMAQRVSGALLESSDFDALAEIKRSLD